MIITKRKITGSKVCIKVTFLLTVSTIIQNPMSKIRFPNPCEPEKFLKFHVLIQSLNNLYQSLINLYSIPSISHQS